MTRYYVSLRSNLTEAQKMRAYRIMGYVLLDYKRAHCVNGTVLKELVSRSLIEGAIDEVRVMHGAITTNIF